MIFLLDFGKSSDSVVFVAFHITGHHYGMFFLFIHNFPMTFHISKHGHNFLYTFICVLPSLLNRMDGVTVSVLASSAVDRWFYSRSGQTKDYEIGICYFSAKQADQRSKSKDWLVLNQDNASEWSNMSTHELVLQWVTNTIKSS